MDIQSLINCFDEAKKKNIQYIGVAIQLPSARGREVIINTFENFDYKLEYYKNTYDENLEHRHVKGLKIVGFNYGNLFAEIEYNLL